MASLGKNADQVPREPWELAVVPSSSYRSDLFTWTREQAAALKSRDFSAMDWDNLIEEVIDMGDIRKEKWESRYIRAIRYMLRVLYSAERQSVRKWRRKTRACRQKMKWRLDRNPGIETEFGTLQDELWFDGRIEAIRSEVRWAEARGATEIELRSVHAKLERTIPTDPQWTIVEVIGYNPWNCKRGDRPSENIWPPEVARQLNEDLGTDYDERGWDVHLDQRKLRHRLDHTSDGIDQSAAEHARPDIEREPSRTSGGYDIDR